MKKYTIETLTEINRRFTNTHLKIYQSDVDMVNKFIELIENTRSAATPQPGDIVEYTNIYGEYFPHAHIETNNDGYIHLCERASTYISKSDDEKIICSSSGGTWNHIEVEKFEYIGMTERSFWSFGHCGACRDGGIDFYAPVNVWKCDLNIEPFSTKTHDKYYLSHCNREDSEYHYFLSKDGMSANAWNTENELQAWLRTHRAILNNSVVWTYKEVKHHVSPKKYDELNAIEDVMQMNGKRLCKRIYDDDNFTLHTYFVWYWDDPTMGDFMESATKQNEIRKQYELDYRAMVNSYAMEELKQGKVEPLKINL